MSRNDSWMAHYRWVSYLLLIIASLALLIMALRDCPCDKDRGRPVYASIDTLVPSIPTTTTTTTTTPPTTVPRTTTTKPRASRSAPSAPSARTPAPNGQAIGTQLSGSSTAYCLTGNMASGRPTYSGAVAMNGVPLYSKWKVLSGPKAGNTYTVEDRIGHSSFFDIAMPGDCAAARQYGRHHITVERVG